MAHCRRMQVDLDKVEGYVSYRNLCRKATGDVNAHQERPVHGSGTGLTQVIQRISEMYANGMDASSEEEDVEVKEKALEDAGKKKRKRAPRSDAEDWYDIDDAFIDDTDQDAYFSKENRTTKHGGFYINKGLIEDAEGDHAQPSSTLPKQKKSGGRKVCTKPADGKGGEDKSDATRKRTSNGNASQRAGQKEKRKRAILHSQPYSMSATLLDLVESVRQAAVQTDKPDDDGKRRRLPKAVLEKLKLVAMQCAVECPRGAKQKEVIQVLMTFLGPLTTEVNLSMKLRQLANEHKLSVSEALVEKQEADLKARVEERLKELPQEEAMAVPGPATAEGQGGAVDGEEQTKQGEKVFDRDMEMLLLSIWSNVKQREDGQREVSALYKRVCSFWPEGSMDAKTLQKILKRAKARRENRGLPTGPPKRRKIASPDTTMGSSPAVETDTQPLVDAAPAVETDTQPPVDAAPAVETATQPPLDAAPAVETNMQQPVNAPPTVETNTQPPVDAAPAPVEAPAPPPPVDPSVQGSQEHKEPIVIPD
eukprot:CAMPEP_0183823644 /NCGR_PEP_ID=MMETSP0807_2-20130328/166_1 /TAXON_ID=88271 /ORGANISM="Picocystis salinarum, Strain CCMP1897" /LENGTH=535 /DNA_ID=CAMNT_0026068549 /DNA_START=65 /DNA_END=1672 /DNA_ORIENTATION=+